MNKDIQFNIFENPEDTIKKANRTWKDDKLDWWNLNDNWSPQVGIPCLISTLIGFCIETNSQTYCCLDTGIISEIDPGISVTVCINPSDKNYFKSGKHYRVGWYEIDPELTGSYDNYLNK